MTTVVYDTNSSAQSEAKRLATAVALLALAGFQMRQLATGGYFAWGIGRARFAGELEDLEAFAEEVRK